jgi:hypothetical protein
MDNIDTDKHDVVHVFCLCDIIVCSEKQRISYCRMMVCKLFINLIII